jgi:acyl-CoA hydrolase
MATGDRTATKPPEIGAMLAQKRRSPEAVLEHIGEGADLIVGLGNGEPVTVLDEIEANAGRLSGVSVHQMLPLRERRYMHGVYPGLRHVSWFLSPANREAFHKGACELVPNNFSDVPRLMQHSTRCSLVLAAVSPPDRHGYFSLGSHAEYAAAMIGEVPYFVGVNHRKMLVAQDEEGHP